MNNPHTVNWARQAWDEPVTEHVARAEQSSSFPRVRQVGKPEGRNVWSWAFWSTRWVLLLERSEWGDWCDRLSVNTILRWRLVCREYCVLWQLWRGRNEVGLCRGKRLAAEHFFRNLFCPYRETLYCFPALGQAGRVFIPLHLSVIVMWPPGKGVSSWAR